LFLFLDDDQFTHTTSGRLRPTISLMTTALSLVKRHARRFTEKMKKWSGVISRGYIQLRARGVNAFGRLNRSGERVGMFCSTSALHLAGKRCVLLQGQVRQKNYIKMRRILR